MDETKYLIGDLSKIFNISKEMIRYYEKQGAIEPERVNENNYRTYSIWDIYELVEMLQYREFNISIKNLAREKKGDASEWIRTNLLKYYYETEEEIDKLLLSKLRTKEILDQIECYELNEGNFWVKRIPRYYGYHFLSSRNDHYDDIDMDSSVRKAVFHSDVIKYLNPLVKFEEKQEWFYIISEEYKSILPKGILDKAVIQEPEFCLCTIADMGEIGDFTENICKNAIEYCETKGYEITGIPTGMIISRGVEGKAFRRRMEIRIPINYKNINYKND